MKTKTDIDNVKNMSNVVQFNEGELSSFLGQYRKDRSSSGIPSEWPILLMGGPGRFPKLKEIGITPRSDT